MHNTLASRVGWTRRELDHPLPDAPRITLNGKIYHSKESGEYLTSLYSINFPQRVFPHECYRKCALSVDVCKTTGQIETGFFLLQIYSETLWRCLGIEREAYPKWRSVFPGLSAHRRYSSFPEASKFTDKNERLSVTGAIKKMKLLNAVAFGFPLVGWSGGLLRRWHLHRDREAKEQGMKRTLWAEGTVNAKVLTWGDGQCFEGTGRSLGRQAVVVKRGRSNWGRRERGGQCSESDAREFESHLHRLPDLGQWGKRLNCRTLDFLICKHVSLSRSNHF